MKKMISLLGYAFAALLLSLSVARAEITIGIILAITGPMSSMALPYQGVYAQLPDTIAGEKVRYLTLDDGGDPTTSVKNARKLIEQGTDLILGASTTPTCLAIVDIVVESKVPQICMSPLVVSEQQRPWVFSVPQQVPVMLSAVIEHMKAHGVKTVGFIGFADGWGDLNWQALTKMAGEAGITIVAQERYARLDSSVTAQVLKIMAARPDAVFVGAAGTPAALPHITLAQRGYKGQIYHTHGIIGPDFIRIGGVNIEGAIAPSGPLIVADELPDSNPIKKVALTFFKEYGVKYPQIHNSFAGYAYDIFLIVKAALPGALAKAKPGTPEFRQALRDSLENVKDVVGTHAVYNMSPTDHNGVDQRARVLVRVENGAFRLVK